MPVQYPLVRSNDQSDGQAFEIDKTEADIQQLYDALNEGLPESIHGAGSATDAVIGSRTADPAIADVYSETGVLTQFLSWFTKRIAAVLGADWKASIPITLIAAKEHVDAAAPHLGHETPAGAQAKVDVHANKTDNPHTVTAEQTGALASIGGVGNAGGDIGLTAGTGIRLTIDEINKDIMIEATGEAIPGAHATEHAAAGDDPVTPESIGAIPLPASLGVNDFLIADTNGDIVKKTLDEIKVILELPYVPKNATETTKGIIEVATLEEVAIGSSSAIAVNPAGVKQECDKRVLATDVATALAANKIPKADANGNLNFNGKQGLGFVIETRTADYASPPVGQIWIRTDL
jgi:hypothetical protein